MRYKSAHEPLLNAMCRREDRARIDQGARAESAILVDEGDHVAEKIAAVVIIADASRSLRSVVIKNQGLGGSGIAEKQRECDQACGKGPGQACGCVQAKPQLCNIILTPPAYLYRLAVL